VNICLGTFHTGRVILLEAYPDQSVIYKSSVSNNEKSLEEHAMRHCISTLEPWSNEKRHYEQPIDEDSGID
jgi:hypothetical protein